MKKILFIVPTILETLGGIEKYTLLLLKIIHNNYKNYKIDIVVLQKKPSNYKKYNGLNFNYFFPNTKYENNSKNIFKKSYSEWCIFHVIKKTVYKLNKINKYDLIINSSWIMFFKLSHLKNYILIQHNDLTQYILKFSLNIFKNPRKFFSFFILFNKVSKNISNFIVYDNLNKNLAMKYIDGKIFTVPLCISFSNNYLDKNLILNRSKILYLGRINESQKNISYLIKLNKKINLIDFYGESYNRSDEKYKNILKQNMWYKGKIQTDESKIKLIKNYKFLILLSNYEGFSFSLVEALACGVPIIVKDTFLSAKYLCNENTGLLLSKDNSFEKDIELIFKFYNMSKDDYDKLVNGSLFFFKNNLSYEIFKKKWEQIFKKFL